MRKVKEIFDKIKSNKKLTISIISIASLLVLITGVSLSVFNYTNNNAGNNGINSGHISMAYTEPSNEYIVENSLPMKDQEGINSTNYFEFSVTTTAPTNDADNEGVSIPYEITITESEGNTLTSDQIKMYVTEVKGEKENLHTKPTLVSNFEPSLYKNEGIKVGFNLHLHRNGNKTITTKYRLRAWINYDVDASDWNTLNKYQYKFRVNINGTTQYQGYHTDLSCFAFEETTHGYYIINGYDFTKCDSKNIVVPSQIDEKHTIPYKEVLAVHWATEQEAIEAYKKFMISDGFCSDYGDIVSDEDWKGCLAYNEVTEEEFNQEAKEMNDDVKVYMSYINDWVGNNYYEHTDTLDEEQLELLNFFIPFGYFSIETSEETEISTYKKIVKINSMSNTSVAAASNNEVELLIIPEAFPIEYGAFSEINIKELFDKSGVFPSSCFDYSIENEKVSVDDFLCEGVKEIIIPSEINSIPVEEIGNYAFENKNLTSVTIPNSVTTIGFEAFGSNQLTSVTIPNSVTTIGEHAFSFNQLTSVTIPNSVITIGNAAFGSNQLTSVTIPNSVTTIGWGAFANNQLTSVSIPNSVTSIESSTFSRNQLTNVTIPNSVTSIGESAFANNQLRSVTIPNSVAIIVGWAFSDNQLTSVTIPNSVTTIGNRAFQNNQLTSVTIPNSVITIGYYAFRKTETSNPNLIKIINKTGRLFDWNYIINGSDSDPFITGTVTNSYGNVEIASE